MTEFLIKNEVLSANPEDLTAIGKGVRNIADLDIDDLRSNFAEYTQSRRDSVEAQTRADAKEHTKQAGVRFPKNEPIGDRHLGNSTSNHSAADVDKGIKAKKDNWGSEDGHVGSMVSNQQIEDVAKGKKKHDKRHSIKDKEWGIKQQRLVKNRLI